MIHPRRSPFRVLHVDAERSLRRRPLEQCANLNFESAPPVARPASYKGQRAYTGERWTATVARHVAFRSWLERDNLMLLDFDTDVVAIAAQPLTLLWQVGGRERRHTPAFFARLADGGALVADVYGAAKPTARRAEARAALRDACAASGWALRQLSAPDPVFAANLRWLSGYRHPRHYAVNAADALLAVFRQPTALFQGAAAVGDPIAVLPTLYHLLWRQHLAVDLHAAVLGTASVVSRAPAALR